MGLAFASIHWPSLNDGRRRQTIHRVQQDVTHFFKCPIVLRHQHLIQAKRYTNTVDVSAVRDLCAVVRKEGASRGILVTTSTYGADAYAFANNEPITLLNGAELLGLLQKHGYQFRVDLAEARRMRVD